MKLQKKISNYYGVKFNSIEVSPQDFKDNAENIVDIVEEPTGNQNSISNIILSNNISEKVLFSGDGGDEVFTGYNRYRSIYILSLIIKLNFFKNVPFRFKNKNIKRLFIKIQETYIYHLVNKIYLLTLNTLIEILNS